MPQYTEKQLRTTKLDKGEIYLTVTAKHATIADMQRTKFNPRFEKSLRRKSFLSEPFNENFIGKSGSSQSVWESFIELQQARSEGGEQTP